MDIFKDVIQSIMQAEKSVINNGADESFYDPRVVNKVLSYHIDSIFQANEMNKCHHIDKKLQYDYLFNSVRKYKRPFRKWIKVEKLQYLSYVKEFYGYSTEKARQALSVLTQEQLEEIKSRLDVGGN